MNEYIAGGLAGLAEVVITYPLDYIKTSHQIYSQKNKQENFYNYLYKTRKVSDYYNGFSSRLIGVVPMRFLFWGSQNTTKQLLENYHIKKWYNFLIIGTTSGVIQTVVDNQIEIIKTSYIEKSKFSFEKFVKFHGFMPTLYRNVIFVNILSSVCYQKEFKNTKEKFFYSSFGGLTASFITQPLDFVKTLKQRESKKIMYKNCDLKNLNSYKIISILLKDNPKMLFTGGIVRGILSFFSIGIGFTVFSNLLNKNKIK